MSARSCGRPTARLFRINASLLRNEKRNAIEGCGNLAGKRFIVRHAAGRQQIYSCRDSSELNDLVGLEEISFLEARLLEPELIQKREKQPRVISSRPDENIQVPRVAWAPVKCKALRAAVDVINAAGI